MFTKSCYLFLFSERLADPHYVVKFAPAFGTLYWPSTWCSLLFFDLDREVIDLNWKVAHGVLYTAERLSSFGMAVPLVCFGGAPLKTLSHLFFCLPFGSKCFVVALVIDVFLQPHVSCVAYSPLPVWF